MIDSHSHSIHSHDGKVGIKKLVAQVNKLGLSYYAITEHLDYDYKHGKIEKLCRQLCLPCYKYFFNRACKMVDKNTYLAFGIEMGYNPLESKNYIAVDKKYNFDVIINSVHTINGIEAYYGDIFKGRTQEDVYNEYIDTVSQSLEVDYNYSIVGHLGYLTRYAPYENRALYQPQFYEKIDNILKRIIQLDKTIEINTHVKDDCVFLPEREIIERYVALGGKRLTFSSDAHKVKDICKNYQAVAEYVTSLGIQNWTVYKNKIPHYVAIEV